MSSIHAKWRILGFVVWKVCLASCVTVGVGQENIYEVVYMVHVCIKLRCGGAVD